MRTGIIILILDRLKNHLE